MGRGSSSGGGRGWSSSSGRGWSSSRGHGSHTTVIIGGTRYYGGGYGRRSLVPTIVICFIMAAIVIFAGIGLIISNMSYGTVNGTAVSNRDSGVGYYTTYTYTIDGKDYVNESDVGWEYSEDIGKVVTLYYEKDNPNVITEENPKTPVSAVVLVFVIGISFGVGAIVALKVHINRKNSSDDSSLDSGNYSNPEPSKESTKTRCPYCGTKYTGSTCPKCGASNY